ncbi:MAG TPA: hypothetical protein VNX21_03510, partial [Candidatus Thermoplasmatota archaeon]|nr:hypothetical protein [Candidatus Thermoplasmatota archaeon]
WQPIEAAALPDRIAGIEHLAATQGDVESGGGIAIFGRLVVVPGYGKPSSIVDITDPAAPVVLSHFEQVGDANHRGAVVIAYPNGTLVTAISTAKGFEVFDITDPTAPVPTAQVETPSGGHKIGVVPGTPIVYNANSRGANVRDPLGNVPGQQMGQTEIYDLTDPWAPVLVQEFKNGYGCHHVYFWNDASQEKYRATCAGIEYTQIWDTADPLNPQVIVSIPVHHGVTALPATSSYLNFAHFAILNDDGTILVVGDETGGGGLPPGCDVRVDTPVKQVSGPLGNLYFYDVKNEKSPKLLGWVGMDTILPDQGSCTAHHGRLVPDAEGRDLLAMAFYGRGVGLIDFSDPMDPRVVDAWADKSDTWEVWYYNGYLFTGDLARGMDVLKFK